MAKRFTDTDKWTDPWFRKLSLTYKLLWLYLLDKCDICGVWDKDLELAEFYIGEKLDEQDIINTFNKDKKRIDQLEGGRKWLIVEFISFHYGGLSTKSLPHLKVRELLRSHKINNYYVKGIARVLKVGKKSLHSVALGYGLGKATPTDTDTDTITDTDTETKTYTEVVNHWNTKDNLTTCILPLGTKRLTHMKARLKETHFKENWRAAIDGLANSKWATGEGNIDWVANFEWFIRDDGNYKKGLEKTKGKLMAWEK